MPPEAIAALDLGGLRLRRTASPRPLWRHTDRFDLLGQGMRRPRPGRAPAPPLAAAFVLSNGCLRIVGTGKPPRFHVLDVLGDTRGFLGLGGGIRRRRLVGQLAGVDDQKADCCHVEAPVRVLYGHAADDALPMPAARRLLTGPPRFFEQ